MQNAELREGSFCICSGAKMMPLHFAESMGSLGALVCHFHDGVLIFRQGFPGVCGEGVKDFPTGQFERISLCAQLLVLMDILYLILR